MMADLVLVSTKVSQALLKLDDISQWDMIGQSKPSLEPILLLFVKLLPGFVISL